MIKAIRRLLALRKTPLPQGVTEFDVWADDIIDLYDMPNNDSIKFALATNVMHLKPTESHVPKAYFGAVLRKGAATQVAHQVMQDCKARQEARIKEEQEKLAQQQLEATSSEAASNDPGQ